MYHCSVSKKKNEVKSSEALTIDALSVYRCAGPGKSIQGFKFQQNQGRVELIRGIAGGDQNRRKYFSGWCQFIKLAKAFDGYVIKFREYNRFE